MLPRKFVLSMLIAAMCSSIAGAQTILKQDGKFGLSDADGTVVLKPEYDLIEQAYFVVLYRGRNDEQIPVKRPTDLAMYFIKQGDKYAYAYKMTYDSLTDLKPNEIHWEISAFEFDSLQVRVIGSRVYADGHGYSTIAYAKNSKWGMIYIQTITSSGSGIFPSAGFHSLGMGKQYRTGAKYDQILRAASDDYYTTELNGKYGLIEPISGQEFLPEFDTVPVFINDYFRYVKKNGRLGIIYLNFLQRKMEYVAECRYGKFERMTSHQVYLLDSSGNEFVFFQNYVFASSGIGDTVTFFYGYKLARYTPLTNGKPIIVKPDSHNIVFYNLSFKNDSDYYVSVGINDLKNPEWRKGKDYKELYLCNLSKRETKMYVDPGFVFRVDLSDTGCQIISRFKRNTNSRDRLYEFYRFTTGEYCFAFRLDTAFHYYSESVKEPSGKVIGTKYYYQNKNLDDVTIAIYDYRKLKLSYAGRKYRPTKVKR